MNTLAQLKSGELIGIKRLTLSENLTSFPLEILSLADSLEVLDLSNNQLTSLPDELVKLTNLKIVFCSKNNFEILPKVLGRCESLEMVGFKSNKITSVPEQSLPTNLRWLILTDNQITALPETLGQCTRLQKLALAGNKLTELPASISQLINLELVRISANNLTACPDQLLSLPKLAWLAFSGNPFSQSNEINSSVPEIPSSSYILEQVLGQGASGVISKAKWQESQDSFPEEIAVKVFKGAVTSDGYPEDELQTCLQVGHHKNLVKSLAQVKEDNYLALIMELIPIRYKNLGLPPSLKTCTRDTFPDDFTLSIRQIEKIIKQMEEVFYYLHENKVCHGDLYAHNTLFDEQANIIFGDFGAASRYQMLSIEQQNMVQKIEHRALLHFIDDLLSICQKDDLLSKSYHQLRNCSA